jgi:SOS-response transcriptional repressor LexA
LDEPHNGIPVDIYELKKPSSDSTITALVARVSAGEPLEIASEMKRIDPHKLLTGGSDSCLLIRVRGDSMVDAICNNDWIVVDRSKEPIPGQIILAMINGEVTVKKLKDKGKSHLYLVPLNEAYDARRIDPEDSFEVLGVVTQVLHSLI